jgi:acetolactate synthase-1/2/3 large subunit
MVVDANRTYGKDELHQRVMARERGRSETNVGHGIVIDEPTIDISALARSLGIEAEGPIDEIGALKVAFGRALARVKAGEPAVVEVRTAPD